MYIMREIQAAEQRRQDLLRDAEAGRLVEAARRGGVLAPDWMVRSPRGVLRKGSVRLEVRALRAMGRLIPRLRGAG
ncbi:MAG TPA: hypothetical protein VIL01_00660 [Thermomicrobiales bacterium]